MTTPRTPAPSSVPTLLLASASPARLQTLRAAGIEPVVRVSGVDEEAVVASAVERYGPLEPADVVLLLAQAKASAVVTEVESADRDAEETTPDDGPLPQELLVLGCDSMLELDGEVMGKPVDAAQAVERWQRMRGRSGVLHTGHWLVDLRPGSGATLGATSSTVVHFADVTDQEIEAYVASGEPLAVAGAFTVDGRGGPFVRGIEGDHHGVVGLSLPLLRDLLEQVGVRVTDLWTTTGA